MATFKKDHRGLRRRPLYTPLGIVIVSVLAAVLVGGWLVASWGTTTVVLVRHGERVHHEGDSPLSPAGEARAESLARMLQGAGLDAIYVSQALRTQQTAAPTAQVTGLEPVVVPADEYAKLVRRLKWRHRSDVVLVVGHSNTVPLIAGGLGAPIDVIEADEYSGLWIITYSRLRGTRLLALRY
jgi:phosphohistidine phosphatase SixA